jgi:hypothetical protein
MKSIHPTEGFTRLNAHEGKGTFGCMVLLALFGVVIFLGIKAGPIYYANSSFESDVKTEASRAGSHFLDNETVTSDILDLAKRHEIRIAKENIHLSRSVNQLRIVVHYTVPVDFIILEHDLDFNIEASSFVGRL